MLIALAPILTGLAGCQPDPQVKAQDAPRLPLQRCLGAIIFPHGEAAAKIWMFKVVGPEWDVDNFKPEFEKYILDNVRFTENEQAILGELPKGWRERKFEKQAIPNLLTDKFEIVVSQATMRRPKEETDPTNTKGKAKRTEETFILHNIAQRIDVWRRYFFEQHTLRDGSLAFLVNMVGPSFKDFTTTEFIFSVPKGWEETVQPKPLSLLTFRIQEGDSKAFLTLGSTGGTIHDNFDRWRRQAGLEELKDEAKINDTLSTMYVGPLKGKFADLERPRQTEAQKKDPHFNDMGQPKEERILGTLVERQGHLWFFKLSGPRELLEKNRQKYREFLEKFEFTE
jgi:hypothetical protein